MDRFLGQKNLITILAAALVMGACGKQATAPVEDLPELSENQAVLEQYLDLNAEIENTGYRILSANSESCPETSFGTGIFVHTLEEYPDNLTELVQSQLGLGETPYIRNIAPGSPAENVGLMAGDEILAINNIEMVAGASTLQFFEAVLTGEAANGEIDFRIKRGGKTLEIAISPRKQCGYKVQLFFADFVNAYTDGEEIWVTTELVEQIGSEEGLAMIIAHELAHATEGHIFETPVRQFELDADRLSMIYILRAGYDGELALAQWTNNPLNHKTQAGDSHPSFDERWRILDSTLRASKTRP